MNTFIMVTRLSPEALPTPNALREFEKRVMAHLHKDCPTVKWLHSWAVLGSCDYVDVFDAPDVETVMPVSAALFRTFGRVSSEIWPAGPWDRFKKLLQSLPEH